MENNPQQKNDKIKDILERIKKNELTIRPKTYFRLKLFALVIIVIAVCIVSVFLASFILFTLRASGHASLIGFGPSGWQVFLLLFPWKLFAVAIFLIIILEYILRSFRFGYKVPVLYLLLAVLVLMVISGFVIDELRLQDELMSLAGQHRLPGSVGRIYDRARRPPPPPMGHGIFRGIVTSVGTSTLTVDIDDPRTSTTTTLQVEIPQMFDVTLFTTGDRVFVSGILRDGHIEAHDIRKFTIIEPRQ